MRRGCGTTEDPAQPRSRRHAELASHQNIHEYIRCVLSISYKLIAIPLEPKGTSGSCKFNYANVYTNETLFGSLSVAPMSGDSRMLTFSNARSAQKFRTIEINNSTGLSGFRSEQSLECDVQSLCTTYLQNANQTPKGVRSVNFVR